MLFCYPKKFESMIHTEDQLPVQQTGRKTDFVHEKILGNKALAHERFLKAAERLLDINNWHEYAGPGSAKFTMTNNLGDETVGFAKEGFYFSIDLPVPGPDAGDGLEWVIIEKIEAGGNSRDKEEYVAMTVRPVADPRKAEQAIAHFYKEVSTSTFIVKREGRKVTAGAHGRNETPNNDDVDLHDKIRNTIVALSARIGLSGPQWKKLVSGLIEYGEKK
jgi:hypothetical protein